MEKYPDRLSYLYQTLFTITPILYDAALAIVATAGVRANSLAAEIVAGSILSQFADGSIPVVANTTDPTNADVYIQNNTTAIAAYALGYYLELNPEAVNSCTIARTIREILAYLESKRNFVLFDGLVMVGTDDEGDPFNAILTEDNLLAYFAFKQAANVLGDSHYTTTANSLKAAIISTLKASNGRVIQWHIKQRFDLPVFGVGTPTENISVNAFGALFFLEFGDTSSAVTLLNNCENFRTTDPDNGAVGYKTSTTGTDKVWFEGSYAVALAYFKIGNKPKYNQIIADLNRYVDETDGGILGSLVKDITLDDTFIGYKGVGSTSWAIITNNLKSSTFSIRTIEESITGCPVPYFNQVQSDEFTRDNCGDGTTPTEVTYTVAAGRYISYDSQDDANDKALADIAANGQAYANTHGSCIGDFGNEEQSDEFTKNTCGIGFEGVPITYTVEADTYFAGTLEDANDLALADITANGQAYANANGECVSTDVIISLTLIQENSPVGSFENIYATVEASAAVTGNIYVQLLATDYMGTQYLIPGANIYLGNTTSDPVYCGYYDVDLVMTISIVAVSPNPDSVNTTYSF